MKRMKESFGALLPLLIATCLMLATQTTRGAALVSISNGDFELASNNETITGMLGNTTQVLGSGPWSGASSGVLGLLGPSISIDSGGAGGGDGKATISGLATLNLGGLLTNSGEVFQTVSGVPLVPNTTYRLAADLSSTSALNLGVLTNGGVGIGIGTSSLMDLIKSTTAPLADVSFVGGGLSGELSLQFTTGASVPVGDIVVRLFGGDYDGILNIAVLPSITFDNVSLAVVPEPNAAFVGGFGAVLAMGSMRRRSARWVALSA